MKKLFIIIPVFFFGNNSFSQEAIDPKAKKTLDEVSAKTKTYTSIKAEFTITLIGKDKKTTETQNASVLLKGSKYKLKIKGQDIISDGKTIWTCLMDSKETQINCVDAKSADAVTPSNMFTLYETGFKYKFEKEEMQGGKMVQLIDLYPLNPDKKKFHTAKLVIDKTKKQIVSIKLMMKDGGLQTFVIKSFIPNSEIKEVVLIYDPKTYPGFELVDLRDGECN